jgi:hypothetical protein
VLEVPEMAKQGGSKLRIVPGESREAVHGPSSDERLRVAGVPEENGENPASLCRRPSEERERAHDLKPHLPLRAVGERADEEPLVRLDPLRAFAGELFQKVQGTQRDQRVRVEGESGELGHPPGIVPDERQREARPRDRTAVSAGQKISQRPGGSLHDLDGTRLGRRTALSSLVKNASRNHCLGTSR